MSTTLAQMHADVKLAMVGRADIEANIDDSLNQSQLALSKLLRIRELEKVITFATAMTVDTYSFASAGCSDLWAPIALINTSQQRNEVKYKPLVALLTEDIVSNNHPDRYSLRGTNFFLRPVPGFVDTLELTYRFVPATMTASVGMTLPDQYRPAVTFDAIARLFFLLQDEERTQLFEARRDRELAAAGAQRGEEVLASELGMQLDTDSGLGLKGLSIMGGGY